MRDDIEDRLAFEAEQDKIFNLKSEISALKARCEDVEMENATNSVLIVQLRQELSETQAKLGEANDDLIGTKTELDAWRRKFKEAEIRADNNADIMAERKYKLEAQEKWIEGAKGLLSGASTYVTSFLGKWPDDKAAKYYLDEIKAFLDERGKW